jgi:outer membrane lipoprotein-sorting protein
MTVALSAQNAAKKYEIKSAIIQKEMTTMGQKMQSTWYIDDFGQKEALEMTVGSGLMKQQMLTVIDSESVTTVNLKLKTGTRMKLPEESNVNYLQLTPEVKEKYALKELGEEDIAGKSCKKYAMETTQAGQTMQISTWIWKGIVLKSETSANGKVVSSETATKIQEDAAIPSGKLAIPANITVQEL